jgi:localization factor PodJL
MTPPFEHSPPLPSRDDVTPVVRLLTHHIDALERELMAVRAERDQAFARGLELVLCAQETGAPAAGDILMQEEGHGSLQTDDLPRHRLPLRDDRGVEAVFGSDAEWMWAREPSEGRGGLRDPAPPAAIANGPWIEAGHAGASFIAAARRAAQAAAEATNARGGARRSRAARYRALDRDGGNLAVRIRRALDEGRRPILPGLAVAVLALGALQLSGIHFGQRPTPAVAASASAPQAREAAALAGSAKEPADPRATAAIPIASQPLADLGEREVHAAEAKSGVRLDAAMFGRQEGYEAAAPAPPTPERLATMTSIGPIPADAGLASLRQAAAAGDPAAVYELAARAAEGRGMTRDLALAARLFEQAAANGLVPAQFRIGKLYEKGLGVPRDLAAAKGWYQQAADNGNALAMHQLAVLVAEGVGGKPDYAAAIPWFRRAAQHGVRDSQFNLAVLLARGLGTAQDLAGSYTWFTIVAAQGDEDAARKRDEVGARLGPAKLSAAKRAAERWRPETPEKVANEIAELTQGWSEPAPPKPTSRARSAKVDTGPAADRALTN